MGKIRQFLIVANWKANVPEINKWFQEFLIHSSLLAENNKVEIAIAPSYPLISNIKSIIQLCAQDVSTFPSGPYTGEVPAEILAGLGVKYCLVGHSERRKYFGETTGQVAKKIERLVAAGIIPIICAQNLEEIPRLAEFTLSGVEGLSRDDKKLPFFVMYEPKEAISTDGQYRPESPENIAKVLSDWQSKLPGNIKFLYGGSVNPQDVSLLSSVFRPPSSGVVVGHASLSAQSFAKIIAYALAQN